MYITPEEDKPMDKEEVKPTGDGASEERQFSRVTPTGLYTDEPWHLAAPFGSQWKTIIKSHDPRVYPESESVTVALVDPASEVPVEVAEANARLIAAAPALYEIVSAIGDRCTNLYAGQRCPAGFKDQKMWCLPCRAVAALALVDGPTSEDTVNQGSRGSEG